MTSIKKRLVFQYVTVIFLTVLVLAGLFIYAIIQYYYGGVERGLFDKVGVTSSFINRYSPEYSLTSKARYIFENIERNEAALVEILDLSGTVILDNSGFPAEYAINTPDFQEALTGDIGLWRGKNEAGERVLAVATPLLEGNEVVGVLRYVTSLQEVDRVVVRIILFTISIGILVLVIALAVSLLLSKSIVVPIRELTQVAEKMAQGNFQVKAKPLYNDEIGRLASTLNYMAAEIVKADQLKNEFISSISHELRTPLTSIKGWSETILTGEKADREETEKGLKIIKKETERLTNMVEELLDFSRLESGRLTLVLEKINIKNELEEVLYIFQERGKREGLTIAYQCTEKVPIIKGDKNRLRQVFFNILDNAFKFSQAGQKITVCLSADPHSIRIAIADEGAGIPEEELPRIKEKFNKGKSKKRGSGIGLAISDEIVTLHGGTLDIMSVLNEGTTVTIFLPFHKEKG